MTDVMVQGFIKQFGNNKAAAMHIEAHILDGRYPNIELMSACVELFKADYSETMKEFASIYGACPHDIYTAKFRKI